MGGWGSSRWGAYRRKTRVSECLRLRVSEYAEMAPGTGLIVSWNTGDNIRAKRIDEGVRVAYTAGSDQERIEERFAIIHHTGKWFWTCPGCQGRASYLYKPPGERRFRCRLCHDLSYRSVQERRKYQSLARSLARGSDIPPNQMERFLSSWARQ